MLDVRHWLAVAMTTIGALGIWGMGCTVSAGISGGGGVCVGDDDPCLYDSDCCSNFCAGDGYCGPVSCNYDNEPCDYDSDCCGEYCAGDGYCGDGGGGGCYADGEGPCGDDSECCNGYCAGDGYCGPTGGVCNDDGEPCDYDSDCCADFCADDGYCG